MTTLQSSAVTEDVVVEKPTILIAALVFSALMVSLVSSLGAPLVPTIAAVRHISITDAQWILTVTLIVGAVATPLLGRLGDGAERRLVLIGGLGVVTAGLIIASSTSSYLVLLIGRALQGFGVGLVPITLGIARQFLPAHRLKSAVAILSVTAATGVGFGYWFTGVIADAFDYRIAFGVAGVLALIATLAAWRVLPKTPPKDNIPVDWIGAAMLATVLGTLVLALSEVEVWKAPTIIPLLVVSVVLGGFWVRFESRHTHPVVSLHYLKIRNVLVANITAILLSFGLFIALTLVIRLVQTPPGAGYGFLVSAAETGLLIMPLSLATMISTRIAKIVSEKLETRAVMMIGGVAVVCALLLLALSRTHLYDICIAMALIGVGIGMTYAAMPQLIIRNVPMEETGSATGLNQAMRIVGGAIGSALGATLLATSSETILPSNGKFTTAFLVGAGACLIGTLTALGVKEGAQG